MGEGCKVRVGEIRVGLGGLRLQEGRDRNLLRISQRDN